jgi:hypothetical protein
VTLEDAGDDEQLVLGELLNHVLDKGVVIAGDVTISIADIDLVRLGLSLYITAIETEAQRDRRRADAIEVDVGVPVLPPDRGR